MRYLGLRQRKYGLLTAPCLTTLPGSYAAFWALIGPVAAPEAAGSDRRQGHDVLGVGLVPSHSRTLGPGSSVEVLNSPATLS